MQDDFETSAFPIDEDADLDEILSALSDDSNDMTVSPSHSEEAPKRKGVRMSKSTKGTRSNASKGQSPQANNQNDGDIFDGVVVPPPPSDFYDDQAPPPYDMGMGVPPYDRDAAPNGQQHFDPQGQPGFAPPLQQGSAPYVQHGAVPNVNQGLAGINSMASRHAPMMAEQHVPPFNDYVDPVESARAFRHHARQGSAPRNMNMVQQDGPWQQDRGFAHQGAAFGMQDRAFGQGGFAPSAPHVSQQPPFAQPGRNFNQINGPVAPQGGFAQQSGFSQPSGFGSRGEPSRQGAMPTGRNFGAPQAPWQGNEPGAFNGGQRGMGAPMPGNQVFAPERNGPNGLERNVSAAQEAEIDAQIVRNMAGPRAKALSVSDFVDVTHNFLTNLGEVVVSGEISQISDRNHMYFALKDQNSKVDCLMFSRDRRALNFIPTEGQKVFAQGKSSLYKLTGQFKLIVTKMALAGSGMILEQLRALERKLELEGVFNRKLPMPPLIQRVAIVTSVDGRVIDDIATNAYRRNPLVELIFLDTKVQGQEAVPQLLNALSYAYANAAKWKLDVIIIGRGGGSFEDLLCFSDERVVRKVAMSPVPIISAVGHDEDCPLCDRSADLRVSTPTAAAETITPITRDDLLAFLESQINRAEDSVLRRIDNLQSRYEHLVNRLVNAPLATDLDRRKARLFELLARIDHAKDRFFNARRERLNQSQVRLEQAAGLERVHDIRLRLDNAMNKLEMVRNQIGFAKSRAISFTNVLEQHIANIDQKLKKDTYTLDANLLPRMSNSITHAISAREEKLNRADSVLNSYYDRELSIKLNDYQTRIIALESKLVTLDPFYQLKLGLSFTTKDGKHSVKGEDLAIGDTIITLMQGYKVTSKVTDVQPHKFSSETMHAE
ncbi:MAG: exodeoxyribonuclease VII large subunit [Anaerobiospirillum succiniciproducens]|uniref:exodeoxyribonuclease VII large subunit n=1 Tax=Anaerobiospirillum succiniciproducens TaxID=13335 RepID=UPI0026DD50FC|nr:exodeoxyribonuclease VII large subunit [Anaerobiospirillum succiniciproducens]MDO4675491.1 exodeoxyribonuclease VII large subunit [Anaerobiospirillum succiniciproducens]